MASGFKRLLATIVRVATWAHAASLVTFVLLLAVFAESKRLTFLLLYAPRFPWLVTSLLLALLLAFVRDRRLWLAHAIVIAIVLVPVMGLRVELSAKPRSTPIRLLTYNVFYGKLGPERVANEIVAAKADVVMLQAISDRLVRAVEPALAGMSVRVESEFLFATRLPILEAEYPPPFDADGFGRQWCSHRLATASGPLRVFTFHPYSPRNALFEPGDHMPDVGRREAQVASVAEAIGRTADPWVLGGDTNLPSFSRIHRRHLGSFHDAFTDVGFGFGYTFPAKLPWMRIDRVYGAPSIRFLSVRTGPRGASDHLPILVELEIAK